jgi:four helix bundle protein
MAVQHFRELIVWQKAMDLVVLVYKISASFPREEMYGLCAQLRKAVVSIPSNIAEGQGRESEKDFLHFLSIARGSLQETQTQILISGRLGYLDDEQMNGVCNLVAEIGRLINGLCNSLKPKNHQATKITY